MVLFIGRVAFTDCLDLALSFIAVFVPSYFWWFSFFFCSILSIVAALVAGECVRDDHKDDHWHNVHPVFCDE